MKGFFYAGIFSGRRSPSTSSAGIIRFRFKGYDLRFITTPVTIKYRALGCVGQSDLFGKYRFFSEMCYGLDATIVIIFGNNLMFRRYVLHCIIYGYAIKIDDIMETKLKRLIIFTDVF